MDQLNELMEELRFSKFEAAVAASCWAFFLDISGVSCARSHPSLGPF